MNKIKKIILCIPLILVSFSIIVPIAFAQVPINQKYIEDIGTIPLKELVTTQNTSNAPAGASGINYLLQKVANGLIYIAAPLAILFIIHGGINYTMSMGDNTKLEASKKEILWAILGLVIILFAFAIVRLSIGFFFPFNEAELPPSGTPAVQTTGTAPTAPTGNSQNTSEMIPMSQKNTIPQ